MTLRPSVRPTKESGTGRVGRLTLVGYLLLAALVAVGIAASLGSSFLVSR